jgi:hypothetical protein
MLPKLELKKPGYIDVNNVKQENVFDIQEGLMGVTYMDHIGKSPEIELVILDWKSDQVISLKLDKVLGLNEYTVNLDEVGLDLSNGVIYTCVIKNEISQEHRWSIRKAASPTPGTLKPDIIVKPIVADCSKPLQGSTIEFYGSVEKGKAPYILNWYVMNESKTSFIYQPKEEIIKETDEISMISVDKSPTYYVTLHVSDICGNTGTKTVRVVCENKRKNISTIFIDPFPVTKKPKTPIVHQ